MLRSTIGIAAAHARADPHEGLFDSYAAALADLSQGLAQASVLRAFEKRLLAELGYAPLLEREAASGAPIDPGRRYVYEPDRGPLPRNSSSSEWTVSGQTLLDLAAGEFARPETRDEARRLLRARRAGGCQQAGSDQKRVKRCAASPHAHRGTLEAARARHLSVCVIRGWLDRAGQGDGMLQDILDRGPKSTNATKPRRNGSLY